MANVLLVDDEPDFLVVMEHLLKKHGHDVTEAINGAGALKRAKKDAPDVVLLDVMMHDINGWDVCKNLKNNPDTKELPIIMLTVMAEKDSVKRSFEYAGADWHVSKPFDTELLFSIIEMAAKKQSRKEIEEKLNLLVEKDKRLEKVYEMINPKLIDYRYGANSEMEK